jgi:hypothetical protein
MLVDQSKASACGPDDEECPGSRRDRVGRDLLADRLDRIDGDWLVLHDDLDRPSGRIRDDGSISLSVVQQ